MPDSGEESEIDSSAPLALSEQERIVLTSLQRKTEGAWTEDALVAATHLPTDAVRGTLQRLRSKHLVVVDEEHEETPQLTRRGRDALERGLPERRLLQSIDAHAGTLDPDQLLSIGFSEDERSAAIGILRRRGLLAPDVPLRRDPRLPPTTEPFPEEQVLRKLAAGEVDFDEEIFAQLKRRGLVSIERKTTRRWSASEEGQRLLLRGTEPHGLGRLTPELLTTKDWTKGTFRPYDVRADVPFTTGARPHPYLAWAREFEEILIGLGFVESEGPLIETEFWNSDVLFMPQSHPARSIHDMLSVDGIAGHLPPAELLARVAAVHEGRPIPGEKERIGPGWRAPYDPSIAARPLPRSQTTAVSARFLARHPSPPFRMYCLDRNFRRENIDATHHVEFGQCEGILGEEGVTLRHLVGVFRELAEAIGIRELKFRPSYFPFTEPSIEGYVRHPRWGWMEVFPGGMLRPEVTRPLGVEVPVAAWGIGVARLAMVALGVSDIRELFLDDLGRLTGGAW